MGRYDDIINLPHPKSEKRAHMPLRDRAAQFAPFAALTGYGEAILETARRTDSRIELTESRREELDEVLQRLRLELRTCPPVKLTYFVEDTRKPGGKYVTVTGKLCKIDPYRRELVLREGTVVLMDDVIEIERLENDGI